MTGIVGATAGNCEKCGGKRFWGYEHSCPQVPVLLAFRPDGELTIPPDLAMLRCGACTWIIRMAPGHHEYWSSWWMCTNPDCPQHNVVVVR